MAINMTSIFGKVKEYAKSEEGERRMREVVNGYVDSGTGTTGTGAKLVSAAEMKNAARELVAHIKATAASYGLPESVMTDINSLSATDPYMTPDGAYRVDLYFTRDLSRPSLYEEQYDGVQNIIALFNNGYLASDTVYGFWDGHEYTGEWNTLRALPGSNFAYVRSKIYREALQFMQTAVMDFNSTTGRTLGATALLADIYEEVPTVAKT